MVQALKPSSIRLGQYLCAQLKGQETKNKVASDLKKRWAHIKMVCFMCNRWLNVCINDDEPNVVRVCITHHRCHQTYTNISVSKAIEDVVENLKDMPAAQVFLNVIHAELSSHTLFGRYGAMFWQKICRQNSPRSRFMHAGLSQMKAAGG